LSRFIGIDVGALDLEGVKATFCEPRKRSWRRKAQPAIIVQYRDADFEFEFFYDDEAHRDEAHRKLIEAMNEFLSTRLVTDDC
jgi:hypothetical protein